MFFTSRELKLQARSRMRERMLPIILISALYIVAGYLIDFFTNELSGMNAYNRRIYELMSTYAAQLQSAVADPEAFQSVLDQIYDAVPTPDEFFLTRGLTGPVLSMLVTLISYPLSAGYMHHILFESRRVNTNAGFLMHGFKITFKTIGIGILTSLAVSFGLVLFIVPGIIFSLMFSKSVFILLDDPDKGVIRCMRESARLMSGHKMRLFRLYLSFFLWYLASYIVTLLIGAPILNVYITPYVNLADANFYNELIHYQPAGPEPIEF